MKILMIAPTPFFADRGCHTQIYEEIKALQGRGHQVLLCTYGLGRDVEGVKTARCLNFPWYSKMSAGPSKTKILLLPFLLLTSLKNIFTFKPDIIHAHLHEGAVIARVCAVFFPGKKFFFDMQGSLTEECIQHRFIKRDSFAHRFLRAFESRIVNWFPVITQSDSMVIELQKFGVIEQKISNVKDGVDTDRFKPQPFDSKLANQYGVQVNLPRILFMGLMEEYQGVDLLLEAIKVLTQKLPTVQALLIGYPNVDHYKAKAKSLGIETNSIFFGRINYEILPSYLSLSSIAIAPKIAVTEGDGKIYNYMAMGMATVAFDRSVSREILGPTGLFAKFGDALDLADQIHQILMNPARAQTIGAQARERAIEKLSWKAVGQRIERAYHQEGTAV